MIIGDLDKTSTITIADILHMVNTITITGTTTITGNHTWLTLQFTTAITVIQHVTGTTTITGNHM